MSRAPTDEFTQAPPLTRRCLVRYRSWCTRRRRPMGKGWHDAVAAIADAYGDALVERALAHVWKRAPKAPLAYLRTVVRRMAEEEATDRS